MKRVLLLAFMFFASAAVAGEDIDDSHLSDPAAAAQALAGLALEAREDGQARVLYLDTAADPFACVQPSPSPDASSEAFVTGTLGRHARVRLMGPGAPDAWFDTDEQGRFSIPADGLVGMFRARVSFDNEFWRFRDAAGKSYEWETRPGRLEGADVEMDPLYPIPGTQSEKLWKLHSFMLAGFDHLKAHGDVSWWTNPLTVTWPAPKNLYSRAKWGIDITNATNWEVALHELGHAVMSGATQFRSPGGDHKIEECYSQALGWSEGWASFFAASVGLSPADPNAVLRNLAGPIHIENVPAKACQGQTNEWRVAAGLWDLLDVHNDGGDRFSMPFSVIWSSVRDKAAASLDDAWALIAARLNAAEKRAAEDALIHNTLLPARPAPSAPESLPSF